MESQDRNQSPNGLGKLLPKSITKRRRRRRKQEGGLQPGHGDDDSSHSRPVSLLESDETGSGSFVISDDDRSFGSYESNVERATSPQPPPPPPKTDEPDELSQTTTLGSDSVESKSSATRPATISPHPSLIGYLTTASPEVQAAHIDPQSQRQSAPPSLSPRADNTSTTSSKTHHSSRASVLLGSSSSGELRQVTRERRPPVPPKLDTKPPRTPPSADGHAPIIVSTPPTPTDTKRPADRSPPQRRTPRHGSTASLSTDGSPPSQNMSNHRRSKSGSASVGPSKLSSSTLAPLSPAPEEGADTSQNAASSSGFFSSMFSAAQSAANNIGSNIQNTSLSGLGANKSRSSLAKSEASLAPSSHVEVEPAAEAQRDTMDDEKEAAVHTLGAGDLSLSHLGLAEPDGIVASPASHRFPDVADNRARSESAPADTFTSNDEFVSEQANSRPRSLNEPVSGEQTPHTSPSLDLSEAKSPVPRPSSIRSAVKPHRKRGSSVTTSATIGAAISAANSSVAHSSAGVVPGPKLTGFAIASKKRNREFHALFKSVPDDDYLIEDYSCALQREILAHGRLYVSEGHLCFSSNILGWTTTLVMSFDEIVSVEKRSTALVFKNGLMITTLHAKHNFASFTSRDATYDLIVNIWKLGHPTLKSTLNGVQLEGTGGDKTEKIDGDPTSPELETQLGSETEEDSEEDEDEDEDDFYEEDEEDEMLDTQMTDLSGMDRDIEKSVSRKVSGMTAVAEDMAKDAAPAPTALIDFPGPPTHSPTECGDASSHYEKVIGDDVIPAPLGKVYNLLFGPASASWMGNWLTSNQKCTDLQMDDKKGLSLENRQRSYSYIKPLTGSIGPKQTKVMTTETLESLDLEKAANFSVSVQTPDVPSGNIFTVKTKYCLSWAENNATRIQANCTIEWAGKSWLKGPIEKGSNDGQVQHCKDLFPALKAAVSSRPRPAGVNGGKARGRKRRAKAGKVGDGGKDGKAPPKKPEGQPWGVLEPLRPFLEPLIEIFKPIMGSNLMKGLLVGLFMVYWFGFGFPPRKPVATSSSRLWADSAYRLAAYEEMWQREDSELWDWLDERVGLERLGSNGARHVRPEKMMEPRTADAKIRQERGREREMEEAIQVTEDKLRALREALARSGAVHPSGESEDATVR